MAGKIFNQKHFLTLFTILMFSVLIAGCGAKSTTNSGSGSGTLASGGGSSNEPPHGQATINLLEREVFIGDKLNESFFNWLEVYCQAGPTHLIIADMPLIPDHFTRSIAPGEWAAQMFALASTYAGVAWSPFGHPDADYYWTIQDQIFNWWASYIERILQIMLKAPQTTALIVANDEPDLCGARLGVAIQNHLSPVGDRVALGDVLWDWIKVKKR